MKVTVNVLSKSAYSRAATITDNFKCDGFIFEARIEVLKVDGGERSSEIFNVCLTNPYRYKDADAFAMEYGIDTTEDESAHLYECLGVDLWERIPELVEIRNEATHHCFWWFLQEYISDTNRLIEGFELQSYTVTGETDVTIEFTLEGFEGAFTCMQQKSGSNIWYQASRGEPESYIHFPSSTPRYKIFYAFIVGQISAHEEKIQNDFCA